MRSLNGVSSLLRKAFKIIGTKIDFYYAKFSEQKISIIPIDSWTPSQSKDEISGKKNLLKKVTCKQISDAVSRQVKDQQGAGWFQER